MTRLLHTLALSARNAVSAIQRGWKESWARGDDTTGSTGSRVAMTNPAAQSAWVFRCLQLISGPVRALDLEWYQQTGNEQQEMADPELAVFWSRPAATSNGRLRLGDFVELTLNWINLKGQAFWILDDTWLQSGGLKSPIMLARHDRMVAIRRGELLLGWQFIDGTGRSYNLLPQQVIRPRFLNPFDDTTGLAPMDAAWTAASADHAAGLFARNVAQANGDQGVFIISKSGSLSKEQQEQIIAQLRQKQQLAKSGEFRAAFLTADVTIEDPKIKAVDAAFIAGRVENRKEIAIALGVPPSMMDKFESNSIGSAYDRYRLIEETCIPLASKIEEALAEVERLRTGRDLEACFDWDDNSVVASVRMERFSKGSELFKSGVPWDVINDALDLGLDPFPGSDKAWLPFSLQAIEGTMQASSKPPAQQESETDTTKLLTQQRSALSELQLLLKSASESTTANNGKPSPTTANTSRNAKRAALWRSHMVARAPAEKRFTAKFNRCLMAARAECLANIANSEKNLHGARARGILDLLFSLADFSLALENNFAAAHELTLAEATQQFLTEINHIDDPWKTPPEQVLNFLTQRKQLIRDAAKEVFTQIQDTLSEGLTKGETTQQLAARVREAFNGISKERATMIAVTETGAAYGKARHEAMNGLDIPYKQWLTAQDNDVRDTHLSMDEVTISSDEPFRVPRKKDDGFDLMMHPCDPTGSAENCINCRCIEIPLMEEDVPA